MTSLSGSFTWRVARNFAVLATATTAAVLALVGWMLAWEGRRSLEVLHEGEFRELSQMIRAEAGLKPEDIGRRIGQDTANDAGLYFTQIHDRDGKILFRSANLGALVLPFLPGTDVHQTVTLPQLGTVRLSAYFADGLHYEIASALGPLELLLDEYVRLAAMLLGTVAVSSLALGWGFARIILRPIRAIRETAGRIGADNLSERIPAPASRDELASLVQLLNQMFDRLEAAFRQSKRFTADASHELKTPLALVRLHAERLRPAVAGEATAAGHLDELLEEVEHLHRIIESLLFLAKAESGTLSVPMRPTETGALIEALAADAEALAEDKGVRWTLTANESGRATCDPTLIHQLLLNLVANAVRACPPEGGISLESRVAAGTWRIALTDDGPGLPEEQLERIFERFYSYEPPASPGETKTAGARDGENAGMGEEVGTEGKSGEGTSAGETLEAEMAGGAALAEEGGVGRRGRVGGRGHGLGLAIAHSIAALHGGTLRAANRSERSGLRVTVELPLDGRRGAR